MARPDFWDSREKSQAVVEEVSRLKNVVEPFGRLAASVDDFAAMAEAVENSQTADHKAGDKVRVSKNITYYAVYRKLRSFQVKFCMADGSVPSQYAW